MCAVFSVPVIAFALVGIVSARVFGSVELVMVLLCAIGGILFGVSVGRAWSRGTR